MLRTGPCSVELLSKHSMNRERDTILFSYPPHPKIHWDRGSQPLLTSCVTLSKSLNSEKLGFIIC